MKFDRYNRRRVNNVFMLALSIIATIAALIPLFSIILYVGTKGLASLNLEFLTQLPKPVGEPGGGMANAIVGTVTLVTLATLIGVPMGVMAGIYLAEFGRGRFAWFVRFTCDVLTGVPSIVIGIFVYALIVLNMGGFSAIAGGISLAIIMIPLVTRTTEEMIRLVPMSLREASLALGASQARTTFSIVLRSASGGIVTGIMLAIARAAGETAPLLFTALNNRFWQRGLDQPIASLPVQIFTYAISPFEEWHNQAWAGALVLMMMILFSSIVARYFVRNRHAR
ncbi:MAG: phosphate ABC transporter permease PstA [Bacillota bacterium]